MGSMTRVFDALVAEAQAAPVDGRDFSWLDGRATETRPSWGYQRLLDRQIESEGPFVMHSSRHLIEARKPA